jgi:hypothetical protein
MRAISKSIPSMSPTISSLLFFSPDFDGLTEFDFFLEGDACELLFDPELEWPLEALGTTV